VKKLLFAVVFVLVVALVTFVVLGAVMGAAVTAAVNTLGPKLTGTPVTLEAAHVSPLTGRGTLVNLFIGNPPGFRTPKALSVAKIEFAVEPRSLLRSPVVIVDVQIVRAEFVYETNLHTSNLETILNHLNPAVELPKGEPVAAPPPDRKYVIRHLLVDQATVGLSLGGKIVPVPLVRIELTNIGSAKGGVTASEAAVEILHQILPNVTHAAVQALAHDGRSVGKKATEWSRKLGDAVKRLLDRDEKP